MSKKFYITHVSRKDNGYVLFKLSNKEKIDCEIYDHSINPLEITFTLLQKAKIEVQNIEKDNNKFHSISTNESDKDILVKTLKEVLEKRCSSRVKKTFKSVLHQLPFQIAIQESDNLIKMGIVHAIYASNHSGYNIKTLVKYENTALDQYQINKHRGV